MTVATDLVMVADALAGKGFTVLTDHPLGGSTTYGVGGRARVAVVIEDLDGCVDFARILAGQPQVPLAILGRGSNTLVADDGFEGVAVILKSGTNDGDIDLVGDDVVAPGTMPMPVLARRSVAGARGGLEWCVGIPGSVGGAVRMNAGGHGAEMSDSLVSAGVVSLVSGATVEVPARSLGLHFRGSALSDHHVVVSARLRTSARGDGGGQSELEGIVAWRRRHQPGGRNAGSVFVNPAPGEGSAGALIDGAGLRGLRVGGAMVSDKHANFIQADDGATAADVIAVMETVQDRVEGIHGVRLRSEVCLLGFDSSTTRRFADPTHDDPERIEARRELSRMLGETV